MFVPSDSISSSIDSSATHRPTLRGLSKLFVVTSGIVSWSHRIAFRTTIPETALTIDRARLKFVRLEGRNLKRLRMSGAWGNT